ncbi:MAG: hypothetical protein HUK21_11440 [Fibrobacteraceae bacterium]|nr:hypothetical protein [Fibrobacteraceae bacterium]
MKKNAENGMMGKDAVKAVSARGKVLAAVAWVAMSLAMVGMLGGCSNEVTTTFEGRQGGFLVSLVDDSLALLTTVDRYDVCEEIGNFTPYDDCHLEFKNTGLHLVNYRQKKPVIWGDTAGFAMSIAEGFYRDSSVFIYQKGEYGFWKIGERPKLMEKIIWQSPCSGFGDAYIRPWKDGNVLLKNAKGCKYAVLDTASGIVTELVLNEKLAWIEKCEDVAVWDGDVDCLFYDGMSNIKILRNGVGNVFADLDKDSLYLADIYDGNLKWNYKYILMYVASKKNLLLEPHYVIESTSGLGQSSVKIDWLGKTFTDSLGNEVSYSAFELLQ